VDRADIPWRLASTRARDIEKIPHHVLKGLRTPGELGLRLAAYDYFAGKSRRPGLEAALAGGYRQLATQVLVSDDPAEVDSLLKTAQVKGSHSPAELQQMLRAGQAFKLADGHIVAVADARDIRYAVTLAQGAMGRRTPEDSAGFRMFVQRRARALGVTLPADWGRPSAPAVSPSTTRQSTPMPGNAPARQRSVSTKARLLAKAAAVTDPLEAKAYRELAAAQPDDVPEPAGPGAAAMSSPGGFPAVDVLVAKAATAQSVSKALIAMADEGRLGDLARDVGRLAQAAESGVQLVRRPVA
jgi:hypothetical protein